jgi:alanine dehydrogenase
LNEIYEERLTTLYSNSYNIREQVQNADVVIGAVLIPGKKAPCLVTEDMVKQMKPGSVIVDVAIDQGGSVETIDRVTTHETPTYTKHGVIHYSVANMPGAVPRTSTIALTNATMPFVIELANKGLKTAITKNQPLSKGLNFFKGKCVHQGVAASLELDFTPIEDLI